MLAPGGTVLFAGEPSRYGDRLARVPKRAAGALAPLWRRAIGARRGARRATAAAPDAALEGFVDVHAFAPAELSAAGPRVRASRTCASAARSCSPTGSAGPTARSRRRAEPDDVPWAWRQYAYRGYLLLQELDRRLLESRLPPAIFYNLMLAARKPRTPAQA